MLQSWIINKLEPIKECSRVLVRDPLHLLGEGDGEIHRFACENGYTVVKAATNLAFRDLYDQVRADPEITKILVIDRAPARRRSTSSITKAPPPFYPDLLAQTPVDCRINLDLRQFLKEATGDKICQRNHFHHNALQAAVYNIHDSWVFKTRLKKQGTHFSNGFTVKECGDNGFFLSLFKAFTNCRVHEHFQLSINSAIENTESLV